MPRPLCFTLLLLTQLLPFTIAQSIISPRADPPSCGTNYTTYTYCTSLLIDPTVGGSDGNGIDFKPGDVYNSKLQFCEKLADVLKKEGVDVKNLKTRKVEGGEGSVERGEGLWASAGGRGVGRRDVVQVPFCCESTMEAAGRLSRGADLVVLILRPAGDDM